ncbi:hypothetical protein DERP_005111 [Dermatophagoides pteronyssinus]|uniref:Uncharacterized protein n=1 Tax=Dermatophagoides pteronyssinus TaxID=6956 RepID=A0ABQ8JUI1_DERPT|nr:hypothetical protein DERP_005111 [Dermatophagoides pteronyssinus]
MKNATKKTQTNITYKCIDTLKRAYNEEKRCIEELLSGNPPNLFQLYLTFFFSSIYSSEYYN